jgi:hypothetical protein
MAVDAGGRPTLEAQAAKDHEKQEIRIDLAMAKATPKVLKHLLKMIDNIDTQKDTIQIKLIEKVLSHNKDTRKMAREALNMEESSVVEEENYSGVSLDLSASVEQIYS